MSPCNAVEAFMESSHMEGYIACPISLYVYTLQIGLNPQTKSRPGTSHDVGLVIEPNGGFYQIQLTTGNCSIGTSWFRDVTGPDGITSRQGSQANPLAHRFIDDGCLKMAAGGDGRVDSGIQMWTVLRCRRIYP